MAVTETEDFLNLSLEQVEKWISSDGIVVKGEEDVFTAVLRWTENNAEREQSFFELFRHVRYVYVSRNYLFAVILEHPFVKTKRQCLDLVLSAMKEVSDGTEACFLNQSPRNCLKSHEDAIFACGGDGGDKTLCYLPSENKWYKMASRPSTQNPFAFGASVYQGKLYVVGGKINEVECYDPLLNSWASVKSLKEAIKFAATVTFQGFLYVVGGTDNSGEFLSTVQRYNSNTNLWQEVSPLSSSRTCVCAVADQNYMYAIGGRVMNGECRNIVEKFDPKANSWKRIAPTQEERKNASGVNLHSKIFVFGGVFYSGGCPCEMYDKVTNVWTEIPSAVAPRFPPSAVCFKGQIFVFGRFDPDQSQTKEMTLQIYNVNKNEWKPCQYVPLGLRLYRLSAGRILREVLDSCEEISGMSIIK